MFIYNLLTIFSEKKSNYWSIKYVAWQTALRSPIPTFYFNLVTAWFTNWSSSENQAFSSPLACCSSYNSIHDSLLLYNNLLILSKLGKISIATVLFWSKKPFCSHGLDVVESSVRYILVYKTPSLDRLIMWIPVTLFTGFSIILFSSLLMIWTFIFFLRRFRFWFNVSV